VELLDVGNFYQLPASFFRLCESRLLESVNCDTAADILKVSEHYGLDALKRCVMRFIVNNLAEVRRSEGWRSVDPALVEETLEEACRLLQGAAKLFD